MAKVEIYSSFFCGYCARAKRLLDKKGVAYEEYDLIRHPGRRAEMEARAAAGTTVPQIFIDDRPIGGYEELAELDYDGELDALLGD
jgi:glutaredoxin 3